MPEPIVIQADTTPSKEGSKTSTFNLAKVAMYLTPILLIVLPMLEQYAASIPANSWLAVFVPSLIAFGYGITRAASTGIERIAKARIAEAESAVIVSQQKDKTWADIGKDLLKSAVTAGVQKETGLNLGGVAATGSIGSIPLQSIPTQDELNFLAQPAVTRDPDDPTPVISTQEESLNAFLAGQDYDTKKLLARQIADGKLQANEPASPQGDDYASAAN